MIKLIALLFWPSFAFAQQASPEMQALQTRVMQEINSNLQCSAANINIQQELAKLKAELEALKGDKPNAK